MTHSLTPKPRLQKAFCPEAPVEGFDVGVVCRLSRPGEVERDALRAGPQVEVSGDELGPLVDADRLRIADLRADLLQCPDDILRPIAEPRIENRHVSREGVDHRQHTDLLARGELIVNEVHGPYVIVTDRRGTILSQLRLDPAPRRLVPELQAQIPVNTVGPLHVDVPTFERQHHVHPAIAVANPRRADVLDPSCDVGLIAAAGLVVVARSVEFQDPAGSPDRHVPLTTRLRHQLAFVTRP